MPRVVNVLAGLSLYQWGKCIIVYIAKSFEEKLPLEFIDFGALIKLSIFSYLLQHNSNVDVRGETSGSVM